MKEMIRFIGLDVHKDFISVAIADDDRGEVTSNGEIANTSAAVSKLARKLSRNCCDLCFVYGEFRDSLPINDISPTVLF